MLTFPAGLASTVFKPVTVIAIKPGFEGNVPVRALGVSAVDTLYNGKTNDELIVNVEATSSPEVLVSTTTLETTEGVQVVYQVRCRARSRAALITTPSCRQLCRRHLHTCSAGCRSCLLFR